MLKVVLVLRQLLLRLKESEIDVIIKKQKEVVTLGSHLKVVDGICHANLTTEFYLNPSDTTINMQVVILQGSQRKLAGKSTLNLIEYEQAVYHQTISVMHNSPDKQARIFFNFVYFKDNSISDKRPIFLSNNRYLEEYKNLEHKNIVMLSENRQLEEDLNREVMRNEALNLIKDERQNGLDETEKGFREDAESRQRNIHNRNQQYEESRTMKLELIQLMKIKGLPTNEKQ